MLKSKCVIHPPPRGPCLALIPLALALTTRTHAATPDTYLGPDHGLWSDPVNWSAGIPNNAAQTFDVFLNSSPGLTLTLDTSPTIDTLTITAPNTLAILPNRTLTLAAGTLTNAGTILLNGTSSSALSFTADTALTGGGTITLLGPQSKITGINGYRLTTDNLLSGQGTIGSNLKITNTGTITATAGTLTLAPANATDGFYNLGTLRADNASLALTETTYQNAGGIIEASNGSIIFHSNAIIVGGIIRGVSAATLAVPLNTTARLYDVTFQGNLLAQTASPLSLRGVITNTGTLSIGAATTLTLFGSGVSGAGTLTGAGTLLLTESSSTFSVQSGILQSNIAGRGTISGTTLSNSGTITATSDSLVLDFSNGTNAGLLRANGGTLVLGNLFSNMQITNTGIVDAANNSAVILQGKISGGTLTTSLGGVIYADRTSTLENTYLAADITVRSGGTLTLNGTIVNTGTITLATPTNFGAAIGLINGGASLTGGGTVSMVPNDSLNAYARVIRIGGIPLSTLSSDNTFIGAGTLGSTSLALHLSGPVIANALPGLDIRSPATGNAFSSSALLRADAAPITFSAGSPLLSGPVEAINGGALFFNAGSPTLTGPVTLTNGAITFNAAVSSATTLAGAGSLTIAPTSALTADALALTTLTLNGTLVLRTSATPSQLTTLTLAADSNNTFTARLELANNPLILTPAAADKPATLATLQAALSQGTTGTHGITSLTTAADPTHKTTLVIDNALLHLTTFFNTPIDDTALLIASTWLGDSNLDRKVNVSDLGTLATFYGQPTPNGPLQGDFNNDGLVNVTDLGLLATNYGQGTAPGAPFPLEPSQLPFTIYQLLSIPEPTTLALLLPPFLLKRTRRQKRPHHPAPR